MRLTIPYEPPGRTMEFTPVLSSKALECDIELRDSVKTKGVVYFGALAFRPFELQIVAGVGEIKALVALHKIITGVSRPSQPADRRIVCCARRRRLRPRV